MKLETAAEDLEPLPKYKNKTFVIKYGGSIMKSQKAIKEFIEDVKRLKNEGVNIVIVHGGGPMISSWLDKIGIETQFVHGLRVTDEKVMNVVQMVLSGMVNKELSLNLSINGISAIGLSGVDGNLIKAQKKYIYKNGKKLDIGFVGEVSDVNDKMLTDFLKNNQVPVISPIGYDDNGNIYNINADYAASYISSKIDADKLIILTDVDGVYRDINDKDSLIPSLTLGMIEKYIDDGTIRGGMIPKMECCIDAIRKGTKMVHLVDGRKEHCLINDLINNNGTSIIGEEEVELECQKAM